MNDFPLRVLYILDCAMHYGGTEAYIMNYYRHIDHSRVIFDFLMPGNEPGVYDEEIISAGSKIFRVPWKREHPIEYSRAVKKILKENNYKIVHSNMDAMGVWPLWIAKCSGVPVRIAHCHNTKPQSHNPIQIMWITVAKLILQKVATEYYACGIEAGKYLFGNKLMDSGRVCIVRNAIELNKYMYSPDTRLKIREELGIKDEIVIGHVGQFRKQKNHKKIISVFNEILKSNQNWKLVLVGDGPLKDEIHQLVKESNIEENVIFMGARTDAGNILNAFDVFFFPSLFEGLGIVAVEAQTNGLPCVVSDTVPRETEITGLISRVALNEKDNVWCAELIKAAGIGRMDCLSDVYDAGYDINVEAGKLEEKYLNYIV